MDVFSKLVHKPAAGFHGFGLGASMFLVGIVEGVAEATAMILKVLSGTISDYRQSCLDVGRDCEACRLAFVGLYSLMHRDHLVGRWLFSNRLYNYIHDVGISEGVRVVENHARFDRISCANHLYGPP